MTRRKIPKNRNRTGKGFGVVVEFEELPLDPEPNPAAKSDGVKARRSTTLQKRRLTRPLVLSVLFLALLLAPRILEANPGVDAVFGEHGYCFSQVCRFEVGRFAAKEDNMVKYLAQKKGGPWCSPFQQEAR
ncbi:MAG: hypothetical protein A2600_11800 [Candidatus Lambdaproteobacteria bacterium RIFOXYD1_FULL_56_27]|uniref:Uncharacterized protein n=1 Tax=Candidatus Lambdaproteobacteria bacterium RIFOXYD2_FULL_56_26 TaxID=1817773 RepID=A0A1F6GX92_9PROT|nr:MAG: hypothetical protein A2426_12135 [Candidatus Lambdaproteobacteria bacterium RIFOXYC1_FULL_56_13]OGH02786.1 MAG: hypothetical protein A2557_02920 [Candidatus Lambdaproteobacteria bacterium RIFOXYD2_FULL_56_26]OGH08028.1 MAG: hypothetical protein A2600_11800 [Candidatus Lambdaproteobacteria bacterium RIFOXYD1_FULL_56_27]